jgi:hypothetical protein
VVVKIVERFTNSTSDRSRHENVLLGLKHADELGPVAPTVAFAFAL